VALWLARAPGIRSLLVVGAALSMATVSDGFLYLALQRRLDFQLGLFPLLFVATAFVYMLLAIPVGRLADRVGRPAVFIGGYATLVAVYAVLFFPSIGTVEIALCVVLLGAYYAATDGVLMAMASAIMPAELRSTGLALLTTAIGIARLVASILFGLLWTWQDVGVAVGVFIGALGGAIVLSAMILRKGLPSE
jgi:MFS family permease